MNKNFSTVAHNNVAILYKCTMHSILYSSVQAERLERHEIELKEQ